jgi:hypothetical protein
MTDSRESNTCLWSQQWSTLSLKITNRNFNYDSKIRFYSTKNLKVLRSNFTFQLFLFHNLQYSHLGSISFVNVVKSPSYVDKSLFIEAIL